MYSKDVNDVYKELNTSEKGLTINEVNKRLNIYDKNIIKEKKKENIFLRFLKQFKDILKSKGVEEIAGVGETFDPSQHEAVSSIQDPEKGVQEIVQEYRKGYKIGSKVIRHSMVVVAN